MKKTVSLLMLLLLTSLIFAGCNEPAVLDDTVVLGEAYPGEEDFYIVAEETYGELDLLHMQYSDGIVLLTVRNYMTGDISLSTYNIHTGARSDKLRSTVVSTFKFKSGFLPDGGIYTFDGASCALTFYDDALNETQKRNFVNITVEEIYVGSEYAFCTSGNSVLRVSLVNNAAQTLATFEDFADSSLRFIGADGDKLYLTGYGYDFINHLIVCDMKSGECVDLGEYTGKLQMSGDIAVNDTGNGETLSVYETEKPGLLSELYLSSEGEILLGVGNGMVCTTTHVGDDTLLTQNLYLYSLSRGRLIATADFEYDLDLFQSSIREIFVVDSEHILFEVIDDNKSRIVLWRYSDSPAEDTRSDMLLVTGINEKYESENEKLCAKISEEYGIDIILGDDAVRYYPDYVVVPETDAKTINGALTEVLSVLEKYPEGFFAELEQKSYYDDVFIVLCKSLLPSHRGSLESASGYSIGLDAHYILVSIAKDDIASTLSHEVMHVIESVMHSHSHTAFGDWKDLNPEGFEYKNSYIDENGKEYTYDTLFEHTPYDPASLWDVNNIYFFDYYSQTFEKEDRARVFEMLMEDELSPDFVGENLLKKAKYLCGCLDDFFDCVDGDKDIFWERILK